MYRRVGVSAFCKPSSTSSRPPVRYSRVEKRCRTNSTTRVGITSLVPPLTSADADTPIRQYADTLPQSDPGPCTELPGCHNLTARFDRSISEPVPERVDPDSLTERDPHLCESR